MLSTKLIVIAALAIGSQTTKHKALTCWMPSAETIRAVSDAAFNHDISALVSLVSTQVASSASRCFYGPPPKEQIIQAAKDGDVKQAVATIEVAPTVIEITNAQGETALHLASARGDVAMVRVLLEKGASVNARDQKGLTPLMKAATHGDLETVDQLLKSGADANAQALNGSTALMFAASSGHEQVVSLLLAKGALPDTAKDDGFTALMLACRNGRIGVVQTLADAKASLNLVKNDGWSALMLAAYNGRVSIVRLLLKFNADVNLRGRDGENAKDLAERQGYRAIVHTLIEVMQLQETLRRKAAKQLELKQKLQDVFATLAVEEKARLSDKLLSLPTEVPDGTYKEFCRNIAIVDDNLTATCKTDDGAYRKSSLKLPCDELIDSIEGVLVCTTHEARALRILPAGSYKATCEKCVVEGGVLSCICHRYQYLSEKVSASLKLPCKGWVENRHGELKCE